jgi:SPP1 gp7 family putative phage head morphogenesis protein
LNNKDYWIERERQKLDNSLKDVDKLEKLLEKEYIKSSKEIEKEISVLFSRYATDNKLNYTDATRYLTGSEFKEWRYDLKEYMALVKTTGDERLLLELNTLAMKSRIDRLSVLKYQVDKNINNLYDSTLESTTELLNTTFADNYYKTIFDIHKFIGIGTSFALVDDKMIRDVLSFPWSGNVYSDIWGKHKVALRENIKTEITQMIVRGESSKTVSQRVAKRFDTSLFNARRVVQTEHAYVCSSGSFEAYKELDVDRYVYLATFDKRTCSTCAGLDGKDFKVSERTAGVNAPVMHPLDRCTTYPFIDDNYVSTRTARNSDGKTIEVSSDMKFEEWEKIYNVK